MVPTTSLSCLRFFSRCCLGLSIELQAPRGKQGRGTNWSINFSRQSSSTAIFTISSFCHTCTCWVDRLVSLPMFVAHEFQTVASFAMPHLLRVFHLPPIVYCWLFSFPTCRLILFQHSLSIRKESERERKIFPLASETVQHHLNECGIFYFADVPYFKNLFNKHSVVETQFSSKFYYYRQLCNEQPQNKLLVQTLQIKSHKYNCRLIYVHLKCVVPTFS